MNKKNFFFLFTLLTVLAISFSIKLTQQKYYSKQASFEIPDTILDETSVMVETYVVRHSKSEMHLGNIGSGVIVESNNNGSFVLTNRHVCHLSPSNLILKAVDPSTQFFKVVKTTKGETFHAGIVKISKSHDLCLLHIAGLTNQKSVKVSSKQPHKREKVFMMGYPGGVWAGGPVILGGFMVNKSSKSGLISYIISIPIAPGASGSPLLNERGELIGLIWGYIPEAPMLGLAVPLEDVSAFLKLGAP